MPPVRRCDPQIDEVYVAAEPLLLPHGALLVRVPVQGPTWALALPQVPEGAQVTVTLGHPGLLPVDTGPVRARGYRIIGTASDSRPIGEVVDLLVEPGLRDAAPRWWRQLQTQAERIFDLELGPVRRVLHAELSLHAASLAAQR